jgi:hypothetical protein
MKYRVVPVDKKPQALRRFFQELHDEPVIVELEGRPLCVLLPAARLAFPLQGDLKDAKGGWDLPSDIAQAIADGN